MAYGTVVLTQISDKRLSETFFHPVCAVIQQVHSPVIWHCGTGATSLIKHRCRSIAARFLWRHPNSIDPGPKSPPSNQMQIFQNRIAVAVSYGNISEVDLQGFRFNRASLTSR